MTVRPSNLARWLAPVALLACALAVVVILKSSGTSSGSSSGTTTTSKSASAATAASAKSTTKSGKAKRRRTAAYTVKPGDTLSAIAEKTGVALSDLQAYNPKLDTQALQTGQKIKLRP